MLVVVSYDVSTESAEGRKRLRRVAKLCLRHGQRVQFSVFECQIDSGQLLVFKKLLLDEIDQAQDSIRLYLLGNKYENKIEHYGVKESFDLDKDTLMP